MQSTLFIEGELGNRSSNMQLLVTRNFVSTIHLSAAATVCKQTVSE